MNEEQVSAILLAIVKKFRGELFIPKEFLDHNMYDAVKVEYTDTGVSLKLTSMEVLDGQVVGESEE